MKNKVNIYYLRIFTSIADDSSNFLSCLLNISFISSTGSRSVFDTVSLSAIETDVGTVDDELDGGAVKTFEARIKHRNVFR